MQSLDTRRTMAVRSPSSVARCLGSVLEPQFTRLTAEAAAPLMLHCDRLRIGLHRPFHIRIQRQRAPDGLKNSFELIDRQQRGGSTTKKHGFDGGNHSICNYTQLIHNPVHIGRHLIMPSCEGEKVTIVAAVLTKRNVQIHAIHTKVRRQQGPDVLVTHIRWA